MESRGAASQCRNHDRPAELTGGEPLAESGGRTGGEAGGGKSYWLDEPRNVTKLVWALFIICAGLVFADGFYEKHPLVAIEYLFGFYGIYGFVGCVALVLAAKWLRTVVMRPEDYYDKDD